MLECCQTIKVDHSLGDDLDRFKGLYNVVGYVNERKYWLSNNKKFAIYLWKKRWIIGTVEALGTPIDINAWIHTTGQSSIKIQNTNYFGTHP